MDIQWRNKLELILLVGPFTTWDNSKGNRSIIICSISKHNCVGIDVGVRHQGFMQSGRDQ